MIEEPFFYFLAVPAVLVAGVSKGGFGGGVGLLAVPLMALAVPPLQAAGIMLPLLVVMDMTVVWAYRRDWDRRAIAVLLPAGVAGIALGTLGAGLLSDAEIRLLVAAIALSFTVDHWLHGASRAARRASLLKGGFWAAVSGFTSFLAHAGGAPLSVYLLPLKLDKTVFVATTVIFFAGINLVKLAPYAWLGLLDGTNLATSAVLSPLAPLGIWFGVWLHRRVAPELFYRVCYLFIFATGCKLLYDGIVGLAG